MAYGKQVNTLQQDVQISGSAISGTLKYVEGYTQFDSTHTNQQEGNYLALKIEYDEDATVEFTLVGGSSGAVTMPKNDHLMVVRITNKDTQSIKVVANKAGSKTNTKTYSLTGLTLETKGV